jgi:hypothetical protein
MTIEDRIIKEIEKYDDFSAESQALTIEVEEGKGMFQIIATLTRHFLDMVATRDEHGWGEQYSEVVEQELYISDATLIDEDGELKPANINFEYIHSKFRI